MIKLMIEGLPDEIDDFLSELYGSVPQPAHQEKDIEDRIAIVKNLMSLKDFIITENNKIWAGIKQIREDAVMIKDVQKDAISVPKAPEIKDQDHDRKERRF